METSRPAVPHHPSHLEKKPSKRGRGMGKPKPRKFYLIRYKAHAKPAGVELLNEKDVFGDGYPRTFQPPGHFDRGFRDYPVTPLYRASKRLGRKPHDIEQHGAFWLVSDRAKDVFSRFSAIDFEFMALDTQVDAGEEPLRLWLCDVVSMLDPVDESRSQVVIEQADNGEPVYQGRPDMKLFFDEARVDPHHVFRLKKAFNAIVCDEAFRSAVKDAKLTGLSYQDLTPV